MIKFFVKSFCKNMIINLENKDTLLFDFKFKCCIGKMVFRKIKLRETRKLKGTLP